MTDRAAFLAEIRRALGRDAPIDPPEPPPIDESVARLVGDRDDVVTLFATRAAAVAMTVRRATLETMGDALAAIAGAHDATTASMSMTAGALADRVRADLAAAGLALVDHRSAPGIGALFDVDLGVTDVVRAIAETGSLVLASDRSHSRGTFAAPPVHVAIVESSRIVPDLLDHMRAVRRDLASGAPMPAGLVLVTGPSKTADIEGVLIMGVHGPGAVHVLILDDR